jgi:lipid-A-disaccharide synthase
VSALTFALAKKLIEYPEELAGIEDEAGNLPVAMVNLIAGRRVVPELLQERFTAANVATELGRLLVEGPEREAQIAALTEVRIKLLAPSSNDRSLGESPVGRVADVVLTLLEQPPAVSIQSRRTIV